MFIKKYLLTSSCLATLLLAVAIQGLLSGGHNEESLNTLFKDVIALITTVEKRLVFGEVKLKAPQFLIEDIGSKIDSFSDDVKGFKVKTENFTKLKSSMGEMEKLQNTLLPKWLQLPDFHITNNWYWDNTERSERSEPIETVKNKTEDHSKNLNTVIEDSKDLESKVETLLNSTSVIKGLVHQLHNSSYNDRNETLLRRIAHNTRNIEEQLISLSPDISDLKVLGSQIANIMNQILPTCDTFYKNMHLEEDDYANQTGSAAQLEAFLSVAVMNNEKLLEKAQSVVAKIQNVQDSAAAYTKMSAEVALLN